MKLISTVALIFASFSCFCLDKATFVVETDSAPLLYSQDCNGSFYYYLPPIWRNNSSGCGGLYNGPSSLQITSTSGTSNVSIRLGNNVVPPSLIAEGGNYIVTSGTPTMIALSSDELQTHDENVIQDNKGFIIESDEEINVIYRLESTCNQAMVTVKGKQGLGQRFRAGSQSLVDTTITDRDEFHFISVMATENNTEVTFSTEHLMAGQAAKNWTVNLDANETYLTRTKKNISVSGDLITATKPIAVNTGSQHSWKYRGNGRDSGIDQIVPEALVGTQYVVTRGIDDNTYQVGPGEEDELNYAEVVAITPNTEVSVNGTLQATLNPGETYIFKMPLPNFSSHYIETSEPAYVYQFCSVEQNGELGMAMAAPIDGCRGNTYLEFITLSESSTNLVSVIIPDAGLPSLTLNGSNLGAYTGEYYIGTALGLSDYSIVTFLDVSMLGFGQINALESNEYFTASHFAGNAGGGAIGYLTSFNEKIDVFNPISGVPTFLYFVDTISGGETIEHCIISSSCSGNEFISDIIDSPNTGNSKIFNNSICFEYTGALEFEGEDEVTILLSDQFGVIQPVCVIFYVENECGSVISSELAALQELYFETCGSDWTDNTGWLTNCDPCDAANNGANPWYGITCDASNQNIIKIRLHQNGLTGTLPSEIGSFEFLDRLELTLNGITGQVPDEICNLTNLSDLLIGKNDFSGELPACLSSLSSIKNLYVNENNFQGGLPLFTQALNPDIVQLDFNNNMFVGSIPPEYGSLDGLSDLEVINNNLSGCYAQQLIGLCNNPLLSLSNALISDGNSGLSSWEDFCSMQSNTCCPATLTIDWDPVIDATYKSLGDIILETVFSQTSIITLSIGTNGNVIIPTGVTTNIGASVIVVQDGCN